MWSDDFIPSRAQEDFEEYSEINCLIRNYMETQNLLHTHNRSSIFSGSSYFRNTKQFLNSYQRFENCQGNYQSFTAPYHKERFFSHAEGNIERNEISKQNIGESIIEEKCNFNTNFLADDFSRNTKINMMSKEIAMDNRDRFNIHLTPVPKK